MTIELDRREGPVAGRVCSAGCPPRPFTGWLGLLAALQQTIEPERPPRHGEAGT